MSRGESSGKRKGLVWLGTSLDDLRCFSDSIRYQIGGDIEVVQDGGIPSSARSNTFNFKRKTAYEIRAKDPSGIYRCLYIAEYKGRILILHCFKKKTQKTSQKDLKLAEKRLNDFISEFRKEKK